MPVEDMQALGRSFWSWRAIGQPISNDDIPRITRPAGWAAEWSSEAVASRRRQLETFEARWRDLARPNGEIAYQVDHRLLGSALARVRWELDVLRLWRRDPGFYLAQGLGAFVDALLPPPPFTASRCRDLVARLSAIPRLLDEGRANLDQPARPFARLALGSLRNIGTRLSASVSALGPFLAEGGAEELKRHLAGAVRALESYAGWLESGLARMSDRVALGRNAYLYFLRKVALMPFAPEQMLQMARQEWARAVAGEAQAVQRNRGLPDLSLFPDQAAQIERASADETAIRRFLDERGVLSVPDWMPRYAYRPMPDYLTPLVGFGDFGEPTEFTSPERLEEGSTRYIPRPSRELGYFPLSMALDPRADMVHEGIPGHAFQMALSWRHENEIRRHWYDSGANEGIGFYSEEMMMELGLFDDSPRTREMLWSYMRLRALRVEVDVGLALGTSSIDDGAEYLRTAVPVDEGTAQAEAAYFAAAPGFALGYQIGKLQIVRLLCDARRRQGTAFDLRAFHDYVWKNGNVPLALQRWELLGLRDEVDALDAGEPPSGAVVEEK